jgi:hypothetical protein
LHLLTFARSVFFSFFAGNTVVSIAIDTFDSHVEATDQSIDSQAITHDTPLAICSVNTGSGSPYLWVIESAEARG